MATAKAKTLDDALRAAQDALDNVAKDAHNSFHGYKYTSAEAMIEACRAALLNEGLVLSEDGAEILTFADTIHAVRVTFTIRHAQSGEGRQWNRDFLVVTEKGRPLDKAFASALTTGLNYALRGLLLVPRVDAAEDMDHDSRDRSNSRTTRGTPNRAPAAASEPKTSSVRDTVMSMVSGDDPSCPACGSTVYDNRTDPNRGRGPLWKCSSKQCTGGKDGRWPWGSWDEDYFGSVPEDAGDPPPPHFEADDVGDTSDVPF